MPNDDKVYTKEDIQSIWDSDWSEPYKRLATAGIIIAMASQKSLRCVLVGGAAVEFYGQANYATSDIDLVAVGDKSERETMEALGFRRCSGRHWEMDGYPVFVEFPPAPLAGDLSQFISAVPSKWSFTLTEVGGNGLS